MYNGIGLQTPRGSGTNGYVQRNMSFVSKSREKVNYKTEEDIKKLDAMMNKKPNQGILAHERKRLIELKCLEMQELMEEQGYPDDEIESKVSLFRQMLLQKDGVSEKETLRDESGRPIVKESHQIAEANQEKNMKMREALGISQYFVEGSSLDPERKAKEAAAAAAAAEEAKKKYTIIPDSSSDSSPERSHLKEKEKKRKKKKSHSSREKIESASSSKKKKSSKKHKKERSSSPEFRKKKKQKKPIKEKQKHKSKYEDSLKKRSRSSSSSSAASTSSNDDDETSSRSSSRNSNSDTNRKQKSSAKHEKNHKGQHRKRSSSSESIRYSKDSRSRKDIYEAKKGKRKRKTVRSSSSSSSEDDSSPKQYFRLEPVLVKSKLKHKKTRQFIEIPKNSGFDLKKIDKKKRVRDSSSSSSDEKSSRRESKRHKHSTSPLSAKSSKHHSSRMEAEKLVQRRGSSSKASKKYREDSQSSSLERQKERRSGSNQQKISHHRNKTMLIEDVHTSKKKKEKSSKTADEKLTSRDNREKKKYRKESKSPKRHNGYHKHATKSSSPETDVTEKSERSQSIGNHKKQIPKSPSHSPPVYKHKKHIISDSPPYISHVLQKEKCLTKSPSYSPPKKTSSRMAKPQESISRSPSPTKHPQKHDASSKNYSSFHSAEKHSHSNEYLKNKSSSSRKHTEHAKGSISPVKIKPNSRSKSISSSPSKNSKGVRQKLAKSYNKSSQSEKDQGKNNRIEDQDVSYVKSWKSKAEVKDVGTTYKSASSSPECSQENSKIISDSAHKFNKSKFSNVTSSCENNKSVLDSYQKNPLSCSSSIECSAIECSEKSHTDTAKNNVNNKRQRSCTPPFVKHSIRNITNDRNSFFSDERNSSPRMDLVSYSNDKPDALLSKGTNYGEKKSRKEGPCNSDENSLSVNNKEVNDNDILTNKNSKRAVMTIEISSESSRWSETLNATDHSKNKNETSPAKDVKFIETQSKFENSDKKGRRNTPEYTNAQRNVSENLDHGKNDKNQESCKKSSELSRSRSRSASVAHSCSPSASERSSRSHSRSYSKSRSKSYSKSRSKSYSKSRSRSKSQTKSRSRSCSKSCSKSYSRSRSRSISIYSRSRSRSYSSHSRSRSRSIARSPSIPRRRGSPSFLDKRRITSARKRPVPYRRPSPPTPSSTSSWSYHSLSRSSSPVHLLSHSPLSRCSSRSFRSRSHSWSPIRQKYEIAMTSSLR